MSVPTSHIRCSQKTHGYASLIVTSNLKISGSPTLYRMPGKSLNIHLSGCCLSVMSSQMYSLAMTFFSDSLCLVGVESVLPLAVSHTL